MVDYTIFENNRTCLKSRWPSVLRRVEAHPGIPSADLTPFVARFGHYNLRIKRCGLPDGFIYGDEDITAATRQLITGWKLSVNDTLILIGMGLGYLPLATLNAFDEKPTMVIIEPSIEIFINALKLVDLRRLLSYPRLTLIVGAPIDAAGIVDYLEERLPMGVNRLLTHPNYRELFGGAITDLECDLTHRIQTVRDKWQTVKVFGKRMVANTITNLPSILRATPLGRLKNRFARIPVFCVAAGPSLDRDLPYLAQAASRAIIMACDSAVSSLLAFNINPHMVVTADITERNFEKFRHHLNDLRDAVLIFGAEANPDNVRGFLGSRKIAVWAQNKILEPWLSQQLGWEGLLPVMTSVSQTAIGVAMVLGCDPIILTGMDLSLAEGRSHAKDVRKRYQPDQKKIVPLPGTRGGRVVSLPQLVADKIQIEAMISGTRARFINTCLSGALIRGTEARSMADVAAGELKRRYPVARLLNETDWSAAVSLGGAVELLEKMAAQLRRLRPACREGIQIASVKPAVRLSETNRKTLERAVGRLNQYLESFHKVHQKSLAALEDARLDSVEAIADLKNRAEGIDDSGKLVEKIAYQISAVQKYLCSLDQAAEFVLSHLDPLTSFLKDVVRIESQIQREPGNRSLYLQLVRLNARHKELYESEKHYLAGLQVDGEPLENLTEFLDLCVAFGQAPLAERLQLSVSEGAS